MVVTTRARCRQKHLVYTTPDNTLNETKEPILPTPEEFPGAQSTDAYCDKIQPTVKYPGHHSIWTKTDS